MLEQWALARCFWIEIDRLYENRGPGKPGNQLDCVKGTRAYFGFDYESIDRIPRNTKLGEVLMRFENKPETSRSVWYANNSMDKVHLPVPGWYGPVTYDGQVARFEWNGELFVVTLGSRSEVDKWKKSSEKQSMIYSMTQGRNFGFYS
jgi:hypothetical protein